MSVYQQRKKVTTLRRESNRARNRIFATRGVEEGHLPVGLRSLAARIEFDRVLNEAISKRREYESALQEYKRSFTLSQRLCAALRIM